MNQTIDLSGLKDIHVPVEPDMFPLAYGWWVILILFFVVSITAMLVLYHFYFSPYRLALRELKALRAAQQNNVQFAKEVSKLLKRIAILKFGRDAVAGLSGPAWAHFLVVKVPNCLTREQANLIAFSSYLPPKTPEPITIDQLYPAVLKWIKIILRGKES